LGGVLKKIPEGNYKKKKTITWGGEKKGKIFGRRGDLRTSQRLKDCPKKVLEVLEGFHRERAGKRPQKKTHPKKCEA